MDCPITREDVAAHLHIDGSQLPEHADTDIAIAWAELENLIIPNVIREDDVELFKQAALLQYNYQQTDDYKAAGLQSYRIGEFSATKRTGSASAGYNRASPAARNILRLAGYLYKGLSVR